MIKTKIFIPLNIQRFGTTVTCSCSETEVDYTNNTSKVYWYFKQVSSSNTYNNSGSAYYEVSCDGKSTGKVYFKFGKGSTKEFSGTLGTYGHNADGTLAAKNVVFTIHGDVNNGNHSVTQSVSFTTIPRASSFSMGNPTTGSATTISISRASSNFTHTIKYSFGSASGTIATGVGTSYSWTPSHDLASQIPNSTSGVGTITVETYNGGSYVGSSSQQFTLYVAASIVPTISTPTIAEANSEVSSKYSAPTSWPSSLHIKGKSYPTLNFSGTGNKGSSITKYALLCYTGSTLSKTIEAASLAALNTTIASQFDKNTQYTYKARVTDSRGRTAISSALTFTLTDYSAPVIGTTYSAERCDSSGTLKDEGTYLKLQFSGSVSALTVNSTSYNPLTVAVSYCEVGQSGTTQTYINASTSTHAFDYTGNNRQILSKTNGFDINKSYDITFKVSDIFTTVTRTVRVSTSFVLIDFRANGHGIGIGKASEKDALEVNMDIDCKKAIYVNNIKMIWYQ